MNIYYRNFAITNRDATPQLKNIDLDRFPIRTPSGEEKSRLVKLAEKTLALNVELQSTVPHTSKCDSLESELVETRKYIDVEIFNLYGLNAREKKIIELASQHN